MTLLFTDVVGSTERAAALGDQSWRRLLDQHDDTSRQVVTAFGGRVVETTGDGVLATFDGPGRAVPAALALGGSLRGLGLDIRAGVHTGEVELRGAHVGGLAVHIAARVMGSAGAGEVIVSNTVKDLVVGSGFEFDDRGTVELKGVPGDWRLWAVAG